MSNTNLRRPFAIGASLLAAFAFAVPAYAGEDDDDDTEDTPAPAVSAPESSGGSSGGGGGGGGSDTKSARGGVQTGAGAMATAADPTTLVPLALVGGGVLVLAASGLTYRRRLEQDAI